MVKKLKAMADKKKNAGLFDNATAQAVKDSAQQIWLAGMGAFAKAQAEGRQVFDALVREGSVLQKKTTDAAEQRLGEVTGRVASMADDVQAKAGQRWDKLESIFEERTAKALARLGMPTAQEMQALEARVAALESRGSATPARKAVATKAPAKRAARPATAKKTARKSAAAKSA
jgi:poly(hydroxyalkanoate) granule-associated protein